MDGGGGGDVLHRRVSLEAGPFGTGRVDRSGGGAGGGARANLVIRDKAMRRYAAGEDLAGSFEFGDDHRVSLNPSLREAWELARVLGDAAGGGGGRLPPEEPLEVPFSLVLAEGAPGVAGALVSLVGLDLATGEEEVLEARPVERWTDLPRVLGPGPGLRRFGASLSAGPGGIDPERLLFLELSHFDEGGASSHERRGEWFERLARVYLSVPARGAGGGWEPREEVFYARPGARVLDLLSDRLGSEVDVTAGGRVRVLGDDRPMARSLADLGDVSERLWIQHPASVGRDDVFEAGREYVFISTDGRELLSRGFAPALLGGGGRAEREFGGGGSLGLDLPAGGVFHATVSLVATERALEDRTSPTTGHYSRRRKPINYERKRWTGACHVVHRVPKEPVRRALPLSPEELPAAQGGSLRLLATSPSGTEALVELSMDPSMGRLRLVGRRPDELRDEESGFKTHSCHPRYLNSITSDTGRGTYKAGRTFSYRLALFRGAAPSAPWGWGDVFADP